MYNWKAKTTEQIVKILEGNQKRAEDCRRVYNDLRSMIVRVFLPRRYDILFNKSREPGKRYGAKVYDQHPANALAKFVSGSLGYMVNRSVPWIQFLAMDSKLMQLDHIKSYLQELAEQVLYAVGRSNFYNAIVPCKLDADSIGTSVMIPMEDEVNDRVVFDVVHPRDSFIMTDKFGDARVYHRLLKLTRMTAVERFGKEVLPNIWFDENKELKDILQEDEYIWTVYPNGDYDNDSSLSEDLPYRTLCILRKSGDRKKSNLVYNHGRDKFVIVYRTGRESGADYGTSIAADCLTAALTVNKLSEKAIAAAHKVVEPSKVASKSIRSSLNRAGGGRPGSTVWVDDIQREGVKTWGDRLDWPITDAQIQRLSEQIEDRMFIRFFEMLSAGDLKARTAYEVSQMMAEKATLMSTIVDTLEQECLEPSLATIILAENAANRMPPVPEELMAAGGRVDIRYLGPLHQLQMSLLRSRGTIDALAIIEQMMAMNPNVGMVFDWLELAEDVTVAQGLPQKLILSKAEVNKQIQIQAQKQQAMEQAAVMEQVGKAASGLGKAPEEGSPEQLLLEGAAA